MSDDVENSEIAPRSWIERLSQALVREPQDREQLLAVLRDAEERHVLDPQALTMIEGVLQVSVMRARDIMIPRSQMTVIKENQTFSEIMPLVIDSGHSRFPVMAENHDEVRGILLAKDLLKFNTPEHEQEFDIRNIWRPFVLAPESKRLDVLLREFRLKHNHMALVVDEYGSIAGLVTIEDVLEQIVGEIEDEYDIEEELNIKKHSDTKFIVKAQTPVKDFNEYFNENFSDEDYDTIGGLILHEFGHLPKRGEETSYGKFDFKVLSADKRRIHLLQASMAK